MADWLAKYFHKCNWLYFAIVTFARLGKKMFQFCGVAMAINGNAKMVRREHHTSAIHNIYVCTQISAHECIKSKMMGTRIKGGLNLFKL